MMFDFNITVYDNENLDRNEETKGYITLRVLFLRLDYGIPHGT